MGLSDIPFLQQNYLDRVLSTLGDRDLLIMLNYILYSTCFLQDPDSLGTGIYYRHTCQRTSNLGYVTLQIYRLEGRQSQFPEYRNIILVTEGTDHQDPGTEFHVDAGMGPDLYCG